MENHRHQMGPWNYLETLFAFSVCLFSYSPTALCHAFNSYFNSPPLSADDLPSCCMGKIEAIRRILLHLTINQYTTTHIWTRFLHLLFNSMEEMSLLLSKANPCTWVTGLLHCDYPKNVPHPPPRHYPVYLLPLSGTHDPLLSNRIWQKWWIIVLVITGNYMRLYLAKTGAKIPLGLMK